MTLARSYFLVRRVLARRVVAVPPAATRSAATCSNRPVNMRPNGSLPTCRDLSAGLIPCPCLAATSKFVGLPITQHRRGHSTQLCPWFNLVGQQAAARTILNHNLKSLPLTRTMGTNNIV